MESSPVRKKAPRPLVLKFAVIVGAPFGIFCLVSLLFLTEWSRARFLEDARRIGEEGEQEMQAGARELIDTSDSLLRGSVERITEANSADLSGIPFRLWGIDPAVEEDLKEEIKLRGESLKDRSMANAEAINREFRRRADERTSNRIDAMRVRQDRAARMFASRLQGNTVLVLAVSTVLLAGVLWAGLWFTVLRPARVIRRGAETIGGGDLSHRITWSSGDELGALSDSFNAMGGALSRTLEELSWKQRELEEANREIHEWNRNLEARVAEKTVELEKSLGALQRTQNELVHAAKMAGLGTLAGGVAHEFNNMIGGIRGCAEDALEEKDPSEVREALHMIVKTSTRACAVIENLLNFSRKAPCRNETLSLSKVVQDTVRLVETEAARAGARIDTALDPDAVVSGDQAQLHQVLLNLVTNAIHAVEEVETRIVKVETRVEEDEVFLEVSDSGKGVPSGQESRIFEPFFTTKNGDGPAARMGTGLGLSVSFGIVEAHGGSLESCPGKTGGAMFRVRLPLEDKNETRMDGEIDG